MSRESTSRTGARDSRRARPPNAAGASAPQASGQAVAREALALVARLVSVCLVALPLFTTSCSVVDVQRGPPLNASARWALLPVLNLAEAPHAGERVEVMLMTLLRARGVGSLRIYPPPVEDDVLPELDERKRFEKAREWALGERFEYTVSGSVTEWRYKSGLDGEPAIGVSLQVTELMTGRVIWSGSGARTGWGRESLSGVAQKLISRLLDELVLVGSGLAAGR